MTKEVKRYRATIGSRGSDRREWVYICSDVEDALEGDHAELFKRVSGSMAGAIVDLKADYAALEKECERLRGCMNTYNRAHDEALAQRDAALLQVEALRQLLTDWAAHFTGPKVMGGPLSTLRERTDAALQAKP